MLDEAGKESRALLCLPQPRPQERGWGFSDLSFPSLRQGAVASHPHAESARDFQLTPDSSTPAPQIELDRMGPPHSAPPARDPSLVMCFMWNPPYKQHPDTTHCKDRKILSLTQPSFPHPLPYAPPPSPSHLPREKTQTREQSAA